MLLTQLRAACRQHAQMFMDEVVGMNTKSQVCGVVKGQWSVERMDSIFLFSTNHKISFCSFGCLIKQIVWGNFFVSRVSPWGLKPRWPLCPHQVLPPHIWTLNWCFFSQCNISMSPHGWQAVTCIVSKIHPSVRHFKCNQPLFVWVHSLQLSLHSFSPHVASLFLLWHNIWWHVQDDLVEKG